MSELFGEAVGREIADVSLELERVRDLADGVSRTLTRSLRNAMLEGRSLRTLLADIGRAFADIALRAALRPVGNLLGGAVETMFNTLNPALGGVTPFAKGGVVAAPTFFPRPGGWGLMGEAGPEAILPLARGADGRLGVAAGGTGSGVHVVFNVSTPDARSFATAEAEMGAMLLRTVRRGMRAS